MKKVLVSVLTVSLFFLACKKDDATPNYGSSILGKWMFVNQIGLFTPKSGGAFRDTIVYNNGSYTQFSTTGKAYLFVNDSSQISYDTATYTVIGNKIYTITSLGIKDTTTILSLNANNLTLYKLDKSNPTGIEEVWTNLKK